MRQRSFASAEFALKKKRTRRGKLLAKMERVLPWARLIAVIEPLNLTSGRVGLQPMGGASTEAQAAARDATSSAPSGRTRTSDHEIS